MKVTIIAAVAQNGVIGVDGKLPWHLPADLKRFKALTLGKPVIMGRKTWESLPVKPLPGRYNIIVSRSVVNGFQSIDPDTAVADSVFLAMALAGDSEEVFVIGGAEIYRAALPFADRLEITRVLRDVDGDTVFPDFAEGDVEWLRTNVEPERYETGLPYRFETYERKTA